MSSHYIAIRTSEEKPLVSSNEELDEYSSTFNASQKVIAKKFVIGIYFLCAVTVLTAIISVFTTINTLQLLPTPVDDIGSLPRPDIFVGLPKDPQLPNKDLMPQMKDDAPHHSHTHTHDNSN
ncbi:hypothetical protein M422DRAFT_67597 [Sphaerobolus stellatus SS14]|uniref:Uncharacterized protein n=1 Tax=Sphaerobolus stellatus (strain SS14) TaxID=990650 RepID=A0A0C9VBK6_SPHS4|nr:hypothetical protein M422DRAFT_67597 [Sphaerobolus stellatus SS14]